MALYPTASATAMQSTKISGANVENKQVAEVMRKCRVNLAGADVSAAPVGENVKVVPVFAGESITRGWVRTVVPSTTASSVFGAGLGADATGNLTGAAKTTAATSAADTYVALSGTGLGTVITADGFVTLVHGTTKALDGVFEVIIFVAEVAPA